MVLRTEIKHRLETFRFGSQTPNPEPCASSLLLLCHPSIPPFLPPSPSPGCSREGNGAATQLYRRAPSIGVRACAWGQHHAHAQSVARLPTLHRVLSNRQFLSAVYEAGRERCTNAVPVRGPTHLRGGGSKLRKHVCFCVLITHTPNSRRSKKHTLTSPSHSVAPSLHAPSRASARRLS